MSSDFSSFTRPPEDRRRGYVAMPPITDGVARDVRRLSAEILKYDASMIAAAQLTQRTTYAKTEHKPRDYYQRQRLADLLGNVNANQTYLDSDPIGLFISTNLELRTFLQSPGVRHLVLAAGDVLLGASQSRFAVGIFERTCHDIAQHARLPVAADGAIAFVMRAVAVGTAREFDPEETQRPFDAEKVTSARDGDHRFAAHAYDHLIRPLPIRDQDHESLYKAASFACREADSRLNVLLARHDAFPNGDDWRAATLAELGLDTPSRDIGIDLQF